MEGSAAFKPDQPSVFHRYQQLIGARATERLLKKARRLAGVSVLHVNSTRQGGGVAEILGSLTPLMNELAIQTEWLVIEGSPEFFVFTKDIHNALQGEHVGLAPEGMQLHRDIVHANVARARLDDYDVVIVHDPQPLPLVEARTRQKWVWWCHIDLSAPDRDAWNYLAPIVDRYDMAVFSLSEYAQRLGIPQRFIMPAIDPFSPTNQDLSRPEVSQHLARYGIPQDLPLVVQAGRFDKWKDPKGVVDAFCIAAEQAPATLVLVGNTAADDPEGPAMYDAIRKCCTDRILVIAAEDHLLVNALQRRAAVVLQKSIREGFGLTVSEAMWKRRPVIGGDVGGIRHQIVHGLSGFLAGSVDEAATHIGGLLRDQQMRKNMGRAARQRVLRHFLLTRLLEDWLDLIADLTVDRQRRTRGREPAAAPSHYIR